MLKATSGKITPEARAAAKTILDFCRTIAGTNVLVNEDELRPGEEHTAVDQMILSAALQCIASAKRDEGIEGVQLVAAFAVALGVQFANAPDDSVETVLRIFGRTFRRAVENATRVAPQN